jgi:predicted RNA binding protein YcfA (HicA-like mRNA interferase family)
MEVITTAEQSTYFFDTKLIQHIPEWEEIIHQITHLNLENSKKTTDFCDKVLKLSDSSQPFGSIKRPFFWLLSCNQYLQSYERDQFLIHIQKIHQQAIKIFSKLPSFLKTEEMQALATQEIQNALTLKFLEFYLQRDIEHLLYNNNMMVTDYIPDEFFDLLAFEIPLTQKLTYDLALDLEKDLPSLFENSLSFSSSSAASAEEIHEEPSALEQQLFPIIAATTLPSVARSKPEPASVFKKQSPKKDTTNPGQIVKAACEDLKHVRKFRQIEQILRRLNLALSRQTGSHAIFTSSLGAQVVVPKHLGKDLKQGTLRSISAQALAAASLDP